MPYYLTSTAIAPSPTGQYEYEEKALLVPHEALRREIARLVAAAAQFDPWVHPWKAHYMHQWISQFFVVVVHDHHDIEEQIMFPYYRDLGAEFPSKQASDHVTLMDMMAQVENDAHTVVKLVDDAGKSISSGDGHDPTTAVQTVQQSAQDLVRQIHALNTEFLAHLEEEERYWPPVIKRYGPEILKAMEEKIIGQGLKTGGPAFELMACCVFNAQGTAFGSIPAVQDAGDFEGWPCEELRLEFAANVPFPVRMIFFPAWEKNYNRFKTMIRCITGTVDVLEIRSPPPQSCLCVVM